MKQISFCTTCKNRFHQISKTLPANLEDNRRHKDRVEFVVVDFGSIDGLGEWLLANFRQELDDGYLRYYFTDKMVNWHASVAKNTAHYYACGEFLVNLDGDNFTGRNGGAYVINQFSKYGNKLLLHQYNGMPGQGTFGRIGMHRQFFHIIGGYDESFEPMGCQDVDLIRRLYEFGLTYRCFTHPKYLRSIPNTKQESIKYCGSSLPWVEMERRNERRSRANIYAGDLIVNHGSFGYRRDVFTYSNGKMVRLAGIQDSLIQD